MGAQMFDDEGNPALIDDGLKEMTQRLYDWHQDGTMAKELWGSVSGDTAYLGANEDFANAQVVMYMSGSWQVPQFAETIGDAFDWWAVPALRVDPLLVHGYARRCSALVGHGRIPNTPRRSAN